MRISVQRRHGISAFFSFLSSFLPLFKHLSVEIFPTTAAPVFGCLGPVSLVLHGLQGSHAQERRVKITIRISETQVVNQKMLWLFNVVKKDLVGKSRLIRNVGFSSSTFLSNNGLFTIA